MNSTGPKAEPCGTSDLTGLVLDVIPSLKTWKLRAESETITVSYLLWRFVAMVFRNPDQL